MVLRRKIYSKLLEWKNEVEGRKALLIEGARRIGKSTICQEFGKNEYESYVVIDFAKKNPVVEEYFNNYLNDLDTFFMLIANYFKVKFVERKTLFIFDEVQMFPQARAAIKYLVADGRYDYMETGSLISVKENVKDIVIPSEERSILMYPLDFEEFLWALKEEQLVEYIKKCFSEKKPLEKEMHVKAMLLFKQYMLVGGMPQAIIEFLKNKDFSPADKEKRDILKLYHNDIMKIQAKYRTKVLAIYEQIPGLLSRHEKRVVFNDVKDKTHALQYSETFFWLSNSMICNNCFLCGDPNVGLAINETRAYVKCYFGDTGLLVSHAFSENELLDDDIYNQILNDKLSLNEGMFYENMIAQMLTANGHKLYFYTHYSNDKHRNDIEIDFIISNNSKLKYKMYPIEVKSSKLYNLTSLLRFKDKYKERIGTCYVVHPRNLVIKEGIICIPPYMVMCL